MEIKHLIINTFLSLLLLCNSMATIMPCIHMSTSTTKTVTKVIEETHSCCEEKTVVSKMENCCCADENTCQAKNDPSQHISVAITINDIELNNSPFDLIAHHSLIDHLKKQELQNTNIQITDYYDVSILTPSTSLTKQYCVWII